MRGILLYFRLLKIPTNYLTDDVILLLLLLLLLLLMYCCSCCCHHPQPQGTKWINHVILMFLAELRRNMIISSSYSEKPMSLLVISVTAMLILCAISSLKRILYIYTHAHARTHACSTHSCVYMYTCTVRFTSFAAVSMSAVIWWNLAFAADVMAIQITCHRALVSDHSLLNRSSRNLTWSSSS